MRFTVTSKAIQNVPADLVENDQAIKYVRDELPVTSTLELLWNLTITINFGVLLYSCVVQWTINGSLGCVIALGSLRFECFDNRVLDLSETAQYR